MVSVGRYREHEHKIGMKKIGFLFFCLLLATLNLRAEKDSLRILKVDPKENFIEVHVSAPPGPNVRVNTNTVSFIEFVPGSGNCPMSAMSYDYVVPEDYNNGVNIMFLLDYSGSMKTDDRLGKSKETIRQVVDQIRLPQGSQFLFTAFHDTVFTTVNVRASNIDQALARYPDIEGGGLDTDLNRAIIEKLAELSKMKGKKILVLLSDGYNDNVRNRYYENNGIERPTDQDVFKAIKNLDFDQDIMILSYGLGNNIDKPFLKELPAITEATEDIHQFTDDPRKLVKVLVDKLAEYTNDYKFIIRPVCNEYRGEIRTLMVEWDDAGKEPQYASQDYGRGSSIEPIYIGRSQNDEINWFLLLVIGMAMVFGLLFLLIYLLPFFKRREFLRKYVHKYVPEKNKIKRDPITQDIINEGDKVVMKCNQVVSIDTWDALGYCPNFPSCMEFQTPCNGSGGEEINSSFFSQKGNSKIYNWLWYGALGGLIGWVLYSGLFRVSEMQGLRTWLEGFFTQESLDPRSAFSTAKNFASNLPSFIEQTFQGGILGTALIATLTIAEELGSTRKPSPLRISIRVLLAVFVSFLVFSQGFVLQYLALGGNIFFSGLINWSVYGILLGIILSINSTIEWKKGLLGGLISCIIAYLVYYGVLMLIPNDELAKLLSFVLLGGILGALIVSVIASLENFELMYIAPQEYHGMVKPISKWLKNGMEVYIGRSAKCYIFIKWNDEQVEDKHAMLIYENSRVHIIALYETLVNGVIIPENQKVELNNDDMIQLGRYSNTKMQYKEN